MGSRIRLFGCALTLLTLLTARAVADDSGYDEPRRSARNVLFAELLGNGALYSLNYARFVSDDVALRLGFSYVGVDAVWYGQGARARVLTVPFTASYLGVGSLDHKLELGLGIVYAYASASASGVGRRTGRGGHTLGGTAIVGYRYAPHDGGFTFNLGFTPLFGVAGFLPWAGMGFGAVF